MATLLAAAAAVDKDTFSTADWLVPITTAVVGFVGALAGVVVGQRISRKTQLEVEAARGERERELDVQREDREDERERREMNRALYAEVTMVMATCRIYMDELEDIRRHLMTCAERSEWWPEPHILETHLPLDDRRLLAKHFRENAWEIIALAEHGLDGLRSQRAHELGYVHAPTTDNDFALSITSVENAIEVLKSEREYVEQKLDYL